MGNSYAVCRKHAPFIRSFDPSCPVAAMFPLGLWRTSSNSAPPGAPLYNGCCYSDGFAWQGDRALANFGSLVSYKIMFDPAPVWAGSAKFNQSEFHKGVMITLLTDSVN